MKKIVTDIVVKTEVALIAIFLAFLPSFLPTLRTLFERWTRFDESYGHGLLIVAIFVYLAFASRRRVSAAPAAPSHFALLLLAALSLAWLAAYTAAISIVQELLLPLILLCAWAAACGTAAVRPLLFPAAMLYFAIPLWDYLNNALVELTVAVVRTLLPLWHISALVEGNAIEIPDGTVVIADGCSGLRYLITGSALAVLAAKLNFERLRHRALLAGGGILLSLLANWVRVLSLVLIGHYSEMRSPLMREHDYYGWLLFMAFISPVFLASWFAPRHTKAAQTDLARTGSGTTSALAVVAAALAMAAGPLISAQLTRIPAQPFDLRLQTPAGWRNTPLRSIAADNLPHAYAEKHAAYDSAHGAVTVSLYGYRQDRSQPKLFPYIEAIYDKDAWRALEAGMRTRSAGRPAAANQLLLKDVYGGERRLARYWFVVGDRVTARYAVAKLYQLPALLAGRNRALVVVLESVCGDESCAAAEAALDRFADTAALNPAELFATSETAD